MCECVSIGEDDHHASRANGWLLTRANKGAPNNYWINLVPRPNLEFRAFVSTVEYGIVALTAQKTSLRIAVVQRK